jgi:hypothetical protein
MRYNKCGAGKDAFRAVARRMTMIAVESIAFLIAGVLLVVVLAMIFGWGRMGRPATQAPMVKLVRTPRTNQGREELLLTVNDRVILAASNEGLRLSDYADQVEQLEALATRLSSALGTPVEFARSAPRKPGDETGIPIGDVPTATDDEIEQVEVRRRAAQEAGRGTR